VPTSAASPAASGRRAAARGRDAPPPLPTHLVERGVARPRLHATGERAAYGRTPPPPPRPVHPARRSQPAPAPAAEPPAEVVGTALYEVSSNDMPYTDCLP